MSTGYRKGRWHHFTSNSKYRAAVVLHADLAEPKSLKCSTDQKHGMKRISELDGASTLPAVR